jgi:hypothetical protein
MPASRPIVKNLSTWTKSLRAPSPRTTLLTSLLLAILLLQAAPGVATGSGGTGTFNPAINCSGSMTYSVTGAPPNACGDLLVSRNGGAYQRTVGWICTDASGSATKGPWYWSSQTTDETAFGYIQWPDLSATNTAKHIWDIHNAVTSVTSGGGSPPSSFSGTATDASWGTGFDSSWTKCNVYFLDTDTGLYWRPLTHMYDSASPPNLTCVVSGMPGFSVTWSRSSIPQPGDHDAGDHYQWSAKVTDDCGSIAGVITFTY